VPNTITPTRSVWADLFADPGVAQRLDWRSTSLRSAAGATVMSLVNGELVDNWLDYANLRYPQLAVSYAGAAAPPTTYTGTVLTGTHQLTACIDAQRVREQLAKGATLVFSNPEHWHEPIAHFVADLGAAVAARVETFLYQTAAEQFGSRPHRDESHVFAIQLEGTKQWTLYDLPEDVWLRGLIDENTPASDEVVLTPGDCLFVPMGMGHRAQAGPEGSLHLTVAVQTPRLRDVVTAWAAGAATSLSRHERLPIDPDERIKIVVRLLQQVTARAGDADVEAVAGLKAPSTAITPGGQ